MQYSHFTTNDNTKLAYQTSIPLSAPQTQPPSQNEQVCILLLHGFSGSSAYFTRNTPTLSRHHWTLTPDLRGHGQSQHTSHGYHVSRLAMDLHELITKIILTFNPSTRIYAVGCSIGAAVLWTYTELFTDADLAGLVFVDQAPLQDRSLFGDWGDGLAHRGCYDEATMLEAQRAWASEDPARRREAHVGLVDGCLGYRVGPAGVGDHVTAEQRRADEEFFVGVSERCDGAWLARLLADHTRFDHREAIEMIAKPVLVMAGRRSGCFSVEGMMESVRRAEMNRDREKGSVEGVVFESGHWLFWEEPERFCQVLLDFVEKCEARNEQ